jgi:tetratricopeptide (TPR) repeat protein
LLAQVYIEEENIDEALRLYDEAIASSPEDFRPVLAKALVLRDIDRAPDAAVLFKQAEELAPAQYKDQVRQLAQGDPTLEAPAEDTAGATEAEPEADAEPTPETTEDGEFID